MAANKVVFVTGGTKNSGLATVEKFASEGYDVALSSRKKEEADRAARSISEKYGVKAVGYEMPLCDVEKIKEVFEKVEADFGRLDALCLIAGHLGMDSSLFNTDEKTFREISETNIMGNFFCCKYAAEIMKKAEKGAIVVLGSVHAKAAAGGRTVYTVTKGALLSMVKALAIDLGHCGVRINYISAGAIRTDRWDDKSEEWVKETRAKYPAGIESSVEDIANAVFYLGSDISKSITGADLVVDSGLTSCLTPFRK